MTTDVERLAEIRRLRANSAVPIKRSNYSVSVGWRDEHIDAVLRLLDEREAEVARLRTDERAYSAPSDEQLGIRVREIWVRWARQQLDPKVSWTKPWDELSEPERDVDRRIGGLLWRDGWRDGVLAERKNRAAAIEAAAQSAREDCAKIADEYASVNIEAAGDAILHDPLLSGRDRSPSAFAKSEEMSIEGCIHSAMFHAAQSIAARIRSLSTPEGEKR
jgi:hypothetical protein